MKQLWYEIQATFKYMIEWLIEIQISPAEGMMILLCSNWIRIALMWKPTETAYALEVILGLWKFGTSHRIMFYPNL